MEHKSKGQVKWNTEALAQKNAGPKYSRFSESIRHVTPSALQCSMFCGGKQCKYENPSKVKESETVIKGLYSAWVTDNILAMARPSTKIITEYNVIEQFCQCHIKSVINLQHPGEHASCGFGLEESGFSYKPEDFMQANIFFYNFGWNDYGIRSLESILDMVKVMSFALQEGKAAVHCHAGLGRTGVLIACYLIYSRRVSAAEAVHIVRKARPKAVQTRAQIECVHDFFKFVSPSWIVFPSSHSGTKLFTLPQYLARQKHLLHGYEARYLKHIPKIVELVCSRLLELANIKTDRSNTPMNWALPSDMTCEPLETDLNKNAKGSSEKEQFSFISESQEPTLNSQDIKHNPFVDSALSVDTKAAILNTGHSELDLAKNCSETIETIDNLGKSLNLSHTCSEFALNANRRISDSSISYYCSGRNRLLPLKLSVQPPVNKNLLRQNVTFPSRNGTDTSTPTVPPSSGQLAVSRESPHDSTQFLDEIQVARAMATNACSDMIVNKRIERLKRKLNSSDEAWAEVRRETDPAVLARLGWGWLDELSEPALSAADVELLVEGFAEPLNSVRRLRKGQRHTFECLVTTVNKLKSVPEELFDRVLRRLAMVLTQCKSLSLTKRKESLDLAHASCDFGSSRDAETVAFQLLLFLRALIKKLRMKLVTNDTSCKS